MSDVINMLLITSKESDYQIFQELLVHIHDDQYLFELEWVNTYEKALIALDRDNYAIYFVDQGLGTGEGKISLVKYAADRHCTHPIILLAEPADERSNLQAIKAGSTDYLVKGCIDPATLKRTIRYALERSQTVEALRMSEERYALVTQGSYEGLWDWDLLNHQIRLSSHWKSMVGYKPEEIGTQPDDWIALIHPEDRESFQLALDRYLQDKSAIFECEYRLLHKDGHYRYVLARGSGIRNNHNKIQRLVGSQHDVTDRHVYDALTGLPNRFLFVERLTLAIAGLKQDLSNSFALLYLDIENFKTINKNFSHFLGDRLLCAIANRLTRILRLGSTVARFGGDEFVILVNDLRSREEAISVAKRIQENIERPFRLDEREIFVKFNIGITLSSSDYHGPEDVLRDADIALKRARVKGGGACEVIDHKNRGQILSSLRLEEDLKRALDHEEIKVFYQPMFLLAEPSLIGGVEALLRWQHPKEGLLVASSFFSIAEDSNTIIALGFFVLKSACQRMQQWLQSHTVSSKTFISVNISEKQLNYPLLYPKVKEILETTHLPPHALQLEIMESAVVNNPERAIPLLREFRQLGVRLAMDNFGAGYSSLSYLQRFPVDLLKIDRSFIQRLTQDQDSLEIVRVIIGLAHHFRMDVVAEGVETDEQFMILRHLQCEYGQGYFFQQPTQAELLFYPSPISAKRFAQEIVS